ncbi:MAG: DUF1588 domain-containing protein, partial [Planctomycetes bacterium]|nr:DUF1588 domain-containing protein [Planctomycetota bacterium]
MRYLPLNLACVFCLAVMCVETLRGEDTNQLQQLTVEQAQKLAQDKSGRLGLDGLKSLSPDVAKELAKHEGWLSLNGLTEISDAAAASLGQRKGDLHLNGLAKISDAAAASLAGIRSELALNGLTTLSDESARALAKQTGGRLMLKGLTTLSSEAAKAFAARKGGGPYHAVFLDGLTSLTPEGAAALAAAHPHSWRGDLPAFKTIPVDVAQALAKREHGLSLPGLTTLSDNAAKAIGGKLGGNLPRLTSLTVESAKAIAGSNRTLVLDGLTTLPDDIAVVVGGKNSNNSLRLSGLTSLTPLAAKEICQRYGDLYLNGLTTVSDETLKALAEHKAGGNSRPVVYLKGLTTLSDDGAAILAAWPKWSGETPALSMLSEKAAAALAAARNWDGKLPAVKTISAAAAVAIAQRQGNLSLDGLTTLTDDVAAALAKHRGGTLSLNGLTSLSDQAAAALAQHEDRLSLGGLKTLSPGAAQALAGYKGDWLILDGVQTLDAASAKALAQRKGAVSVTGLKAAADGPLAALLGHSNILVGSRLPDPKRQQAAAVQEGTVRSFLQKHCADCHDGGEKEGDFTLDRLAKDDVAVRVAFASIFERLRAGDMPPPSEPQPKAEDVAQVVAWIQARLDSPLSAPPTYYAAKEKPIDGNRMPNAILFGGPRGPSVPPPPRLWRLSPSAYTRWTGEFNSSANGLQQPFGVIQDTGIRDFATLYSPDEGATGLLLTNADLIVAAQTRVHSLVNMNDPAFAKENLWPNADRLKTATAAEQEALKSGMRVRHGHNALAALMHPQVKATREEVEKVIRGQYQTALARQPIEQELASVVALYDAIAADGDYSIAGKTVLMAPLMTPEAILRFEVGLGPEIRPGVRSLSPRETAFAISLALSTKRDPGLLAAAAEGKLTTREEVAASVRRILDDPKIEKPLVREFFREFFDYHRAPEVFKDPLPDYLQRRGHYYNPRGLVDDTDVLVLRILSRDQDVLKELLTTPESFATHELFGPGPNGLRSGEAMFRSFGPYALDHLGTQSQRRSAKRSKTTGAADDSERIGILMQPSWNVAWSTNFHNDIVRRGRWVREHLLGGRVPDLPINAAAMVPDDPHHTLRQRQMVTRAAECWKCHNKMDELGLPFEDLDHYAIFRRGEEVLDLEATAQANEKSKDKN